MPSGDSRKDFICSTAANYFGLRQNDDALADIGNEDPLNDFLDNGNSSVLFLQHGGKKIHASNKVYR